MRTLKKFFFFSSKKTMGSHSSKSTKRKLSLPSNSNSNSKQPVRRDSVTIPPYKSVSESSSNSSAVVLNRSQTISSELPPKVEFRDELTISYQEYLNSLTEKNEKLKMLDLEIRATYPQLTQFSLKSEEGMNLDFNRKESLGNMRSYDRSSVDSAKHDYLAFSDKMVEIFPQLAKRKNTTSENQYELQDVVKVANIFKSPGKRFLMEYRILESSKKDFKLSLSDFYPPKLIELVTLYRKVKDIHEEKKKKFASLLRKKLPREIFRSKTEKINHYWKYQSFQPLESDSENWKKIPISTLSNGEIIELFQKTTLFLSIVP